jgi:hypothetical protein
MGANLVVELRSNSSFNHVYLTIRSDVMHMVNVDDLSLSNDLPVVRMLVCPGERIIFATMFIVLHNAADVYGEMRAR